MAPPSYRCHLKFHRGHCLSRLSIGSPGGIRTRDLSLERAASWSTRRRGLGPNLNPTHKPCRVAPAPCQNVGSVLVAAPNLALDRIVRLPELRPGEVQRFREADIRAGGKGVNVCRAARLLNAPAPLAALTPGRTS